jgi:GDP-L-fucose synthase
MSLEATRILVTGANGFLGRHLMAHLATFNATTTPYEGDLLDYENVNEVFEEVKPQLVIHCAGWNGGIEFNRNNPATIFYKNTMMGLNVLQAAMECRTRKVVSVVASCAYPEMKPYAHQDLIDSAPEVLFEPHEVMYETWFLEGPPHDSVACHAYAKRNLQLASKFYHDQYGLNAVCVCPTTMFGPGDSIDPARTKVLMAVVKKVVDAHRNGTELKFMGTGSAMREFIFVKDAAKLIVEAAEKWNQNDIPLNLGTGHELSIRALVSRVVDIVGYKGEVMWSGDAHQDGQLRKRLDLTLMKVVLGSPKLTNFQEALQETVEWYDGLVKS